MTASPWLIHTGWVPGQLGMQIAAGNIQLGAAVLAGAGVFDGAAEGLGHGLEAVADAEHRNVEIEQRGVEARGALGVDTGRTARQHDGLRILGLDLLDRGGVRDDLGEHPRLTDPAGDQLCVLSAEVDDEDRTGRCRCHRNSLGEVTRCATDTRRKSYRQR